MPTRMKLICHRTNCQMRSHNGRAPVPTTTITFNVVANDPMNHWFRAGDGGNGGGGGNGLTITTHDPIASVAYQVGKQYVFTIDEFDEAAEQPEAVAAPAYEPLNPRENRWRQRRGFNDALYDPDDIADQVLMEMDIYDRQQIALVV